MNKLLTTVTIVAFVLFAGCQKNEVATENPEAVSLKSATMIANQVSLLGGASTFAVLAGTTVTNDGASLITGDVGVSPGTALTGFDLIANTIMGPGAVTAGLGIVNGTIYAGGPVAAQAHVDAVLAYNYLVAQVPDTVYSGVTQLDGLTFTPGVYSFAPSANLQVNGTLTLDFQGNNDAVFIFQLGTTLVTMAGSNVVAINNDSQTCSGSNVFWAVGSSATINGDQFIGSVIANTTITMTSGANVSGKIWAINGAVTMITDTISVCGGSDGGGGTLPEPCRDFVTGGGWIGNKATFGVSGGIKNGKYWGQLSFNDHVKKGVKVKSTSVTAYTVIDAVTRQIEGIAKLGKDIVTYTVVVVDNGEPGVNDSFSLVLSNGYSTSGILEGGNIQLHIECGDSDKHDGKENYNDKDEHDGHSNCDNDNDDDNDHKKDKDHDKDKDSKHDKDSKSDKH